MQHYVQLSIRECRHFHLVSDCEIFKEESINNCQLSCSIDIIHDGPGKPVEEYGGGIEDQQNDGQA